jgi:hypothetical protein
MNKKINERALTRATTKQSVKAIANFVRRNGCVCSYIYKSRIRRQWLTCYDQFNEYEQNHTFINFKMTVFMIFECLMLTFSLCTVLLSFSFLFFMCIPNS